MFKSEFLHNITNELTDMKTHGLYKSEYEIISSQSSNIEIFHHHTKKKVLNFLNKITDYKFVFIGLKGMTTKGLQIQVIEISDNLDVVNKSKPDYILFGFRK